MSISKKLKEDSKSTPSINSNKPKPSRKSQILESKHKCASVEKYKAILKKSSFNAEIRKQKSEKYRAKARSRQQKNSSISASTQTIETFTLPKPAKSSFPEDLIRDFPFLSSPTHTEEISQLFDIFESVLKANSNLN